MQIAFRADASLAIGSGHVMRCATLAHALVKLGYQVCFYTRSQAGDLCAWLQEQGFTVKRLAPSNTIKVKKDPYATQHAAWLGMSQAEDAAHTLAACKQTPALWVVDHYALDAHWHQQVAQGQPLLVIDDLADRSYVASLLLDQNLGRQAGDYQKRTQAELLIGPDYVLLRDEFLQARQPQRIRRELKHLLVTMGGVDQPNATGAVLEALFDQHRVDAPITSLQTVLPQLERITLVLGQANPHQAVISQQIKTIQEQHPHLTLQVVQGVSYMAALFNEADLAIGAAGTTSWERCMLGLPSITVELAANQQLAAAALAATGASRSLALTEIKTHLLPLLQQLSVAPYELEQMSVEAYQLVDGQGTARVVAAIERLLRQNVDG